MRSLSGTDDNPDEHIKPERRDVALRGEPVRSGLEISRGISTYSESIPERAL